MPSNVLQAEILLSFLHKPSTVFSRRLNEDSRIPQVLAPLPIHSMLYGEANTLELAIPDLQRLAKPSLVRIGDPHWLLEDLHRLCHLRTQHFHGAGFLDLGLLRVMGSSRSFPAWSAIVAIRVFQVCNTRADIVIGKQIARLYIIQTNSILARRNLGLLENILAKIETKKMVISMPEKCSPASILL